MKIYCLNNECLSYKTGSKVIRRGFYYRTSDRNKVRRWSCKECERSFSAATGKAACWQKRRDINAKLSELLSSNNSMNRSARLLRVNRKTIARRISFLGERSRRSQKTFFRDKKPVMQVQFDDLETFEHTKCKPISVCMAVEAKSRMILGYSVSAMAAKGRLAKRSRDKYGRREDERKKGWNELFSSLQTRVDPNASFLSDSNPYYPRYVKQYFPRADHTTVIGGRGSLGGQGELKKMSFDPLFSLNHTFAMLRANICRLIRKTWCTTKKIEALRDHISIYVDYHNRFLIHQLPPHAHSSGPVC